MSAIKRTVRTEQLDEYLARKGERRGLPGVNAAIEMLPELQKSLFELGQAEVVLSGRLPTFISADARYNIRKGFVNARRIECCVDLGRSVIQADGPSITADLCFYGDRGELILQYRFVFIQRDAAPNEVTQVATSDGFRRERELAAV